MLNLFSLNLLPKCYLNLNQYSRCLQERYEGDFWKITKFSKQKQRKIVDVHLHRKNNNNKKKQP